MPEASQRRGPPADELRESLRVVLPEAELVWTALPGVPSLCLLLLDPRTTAGPLSAEDARRVMDNPLYWIFCWASGQVLAQHLLENPQLVAGKRVVDFGAGSGVVGIAAALAGAREVIACDLDPLALEVVSRNAVGNGVNLQQSPELSAIEGAVDLILAADVLYDRENLPLLDVLAERAEAVLLADSRLRDFDHPRFRRIAVAQSSTVPDLGESREFNRVSVYAAGSLAGAAR